MFYNDNEDDVFGIRKALTRDWTCVLEYYCVSEVYSVRCGEFKGHLV